MFTLDKTHRKEDNYTYTHLVEASLRYAKKLEKSFGALPNYHVYNFAVCKGPVHCKWTREDDYRMSMCNYKIQKSKWDTRRFKLLPNKNIEATI